MSSSERTKQIVILISGRGSNMKTIVNACRSGYINAEVCCVISNIPDAEGLEFAKRNKIATLTIDHSKFKTRSDFDYALLSRINCFNPDLLVLAGFMRILTAKFVDAFKNRILNIHPSLLPKYPGLNTHEKALENGDKHHGASVHFVTSELDSGPVVIQSTVDVESADSNYSLAQKVLTGEHEIYPIAIKWVVEGTITAQGNHCFYNNSAMVKPAKWYNDVVSNPIVE